MLATAVEQAIQQPDEADFVLPRIKPANPMVAPAPVAPPPPPPAVSGPPLSSTPRSLPPPPAAVAMGQAQQIVTPPPPKQEKVVQNNGRSCLFVSLFFLIILGVAIAGSWFFIWEGRSVEDLIYLAQNGGYPPTATPTSTPSPTLQFTETAVSPTETVANELVNETPAQTPTNEATPSPSATPKATATSSPTPTATPTSPPTPTPLVILTRPADGMPQVLIPATTFMMGARDDDELAEPDERSRHEVTLDAFAIDLYEVSVAQYAAFLNSLGDYVAACEGFTCLSTRFETTRSYLTDDTIEYVPLEGFGDYPINSVSWHGASAYCQWVGGRLPTEAEWELAATGGDGRFYPWGDALENHAGTIPAVFAGTFNNLQPVNSLPEGVSPFGLHHMAGNVWEWVADGYDAIYYDRTPAANPTGADVGTTGDYVLRGGGYDSPAEELRLTNRAYERAPEFRQNPSVGFRCVTTP
ncbi:MAG: SUMF1/EgtB/PvdO family nonheme iron enzyme [Anaerolineaceae bacterium]|nr:SUMF1/EgtB/PvdO family nonheme iron enzyme [Anaerolineaceae bacterium]